jgi:hypothetical protein
VTDDERRFWEQVYRDTLAREGTSTRAASVATRAVEDQRKARRLLAAVRPGSEEPGPRVR